MDGKEYLVDSDSFEVNYRGISVYMTYVNFQGFMCATLVRPKRRADNEWINPLVRSTRPMDRPISIREAEHLNKIKNKLKSSLWG